MTTLVSPASTPSSGLKVKLRLTNPEVTSTPKVDSSPDTIKQESAYITEEKRKAIANSTSGIDVASSKRLRNTSPEETTYMRVPVSEGSDTNSTQVDMNSPVVEHPRKWQKRTLVIRTLTGEISFASWRPDGPPLIKRPVVAEKFNSPHPVSDSTRPVPCTYPGCNRNFADQNGLTKHMVVHGPKTFFCGLDGCVKSFADRTRLRRHQRGVHGQ